MRIVQLANLYSPVSGGLRTAVDRLGRGYVDAGHERALVVPGREATRTETDGGLVVTVPGPSVAPGYRFVLDPRPVLRVLAGLKPDVIEVSDKATLTVAARWARRRGVRSVLFSHERLDAILAPRTPRWVPLEAAADRWNRHLAAAFDAIVVTSAFAAAEFARVNARSLHRVPLGVDLDTFHPANADPARADPAREDPANAGSAVSLATLSMLAKAGSPGPMTGELGEPKEAATPHTVATGTVRLVHLGRLSTEKRPDIALGAVRELVRRGVPVHLDVVGDGPRSAALEAMAEREGLPIWFHGHVPGRTEVASLLANADVALATCPVESFGLAVLEALACGTPVVAADRGASHELLAPGAGVAVPPDDVAFADGVEQLLRQPRALRRMNARARAERYPWDATVAGMLEVLTSRTF